jgi:hypothetical protein
MGSNVKIGSVEAEKKLKNRKNRKLRHLGGRRHFDFFFKKFKRQYFLNRLSYKISSFQQF